MKYLKGKEAPNGTSIRDEKGDKMFWKMMHSRLFRETWGSIDGSFSILQRKRKGRGLMWFKLW